MEKPSDLSIIVIHWLMFKYLHVDFLMIFAHQGIELRSCPLWLHCFIIAAGAILYINHSSGRAVTRLSFLPWSSGHDFRLSLTLRSAGDRGSIPRGRVSFFLFIFPLFSFPVILDATNRSLWWSIFLSFRFHSCGHWACNCSWFHVKLSLNSTVSCTIGEEQNLIDKKYLFTGCG